MTSLKIKQKNIKTQSRVQWVTHTLRQTKPKPIQRFRFLFYMTFPNSRDLNKSVQKQFSELFLAMPEALSKTYTYSRTLVLRNARTNPCFSIFVSRRRNWDFGALHLCHNNMALNPATARLALHSRMQAYSFRYYGTLCLQIPEGKQQIKTIWTRALRKWWTPTIFSDARSIEQDIHI